MLPELTERIYAAAINAKLWPSVLAEIGRSVDGTACGLRVESFEVPGVKQTWVGLEADFEKAYIERYWSDDVWAAKARTGAPGMALSSDALVESGTRRKNAFINELCVPFELDDLVGGIVTLTPQTMISIAAMKSRRDRPFGEKEATLLEALIPHVRRAVLVDEALRTAEHESAVAWALVERLPIGAFVLDARARVLHANVSGQRMLAEGVIVENMRARKRGRDLAVVAVPVCAAETLFDLAERRGRTLLIVTDPEQQVLPPAALLVRLYGLTGAEARVALLIGSGLAPKEAADHLGTAWNTVRAQLRQIFAKTQTSGQTGLVRLLVHLGVAPSA